MLNINNEPDKEVSLSKSIETLTLLKTRINKNRRMLFYMLLSKGIEVKEEDTLSALIEKVDLLTKL